jgi:hypothetical protein
MGWDAYATRDGKEIMGTVKCEACGHGDYKIIDPVLRNEFMRASQYVRSECGTVDGFLSDGGLDLNESGQALEQATGMSVWGRSWSVTEVKAAYSKADWSRVQTRVFVRESARAFLMTCYSNGLAVKFSH